MNINVCKTPECDSRRRSKVIRVTLRWRSLKCKQTEQAAERAGRRGIMLHDTERLSGHINPVEQTQRQQQGKLILIFLYAN